jgi:alanyl-tRNA synthetase
VNDPIRATVDPERRAMVARSHTATHLLHWALRKVLGPETVQAGSLVDTDRIRFDFSALSALRDEQRVEVESLVNTRVRLADAVRAEVMRLDDAKRLGALALFGEKYADQVRVVSIGDYSRELCGGTHLLHTGFVGTFRIVGESSIAAGTRRIEALVGDAAVRRVQEEVRLLHEVAERLGRPPQEVLSGFEELVQQIKQAERQVNALTVELARVRAKHLVADAKQIDGVAFVAAHIDRADRELLAALADAVKAELEGGVVLLVSSNGNVVSWVMALTADVVKRGLHAGKLLKEISAITQGGGGGRPDFAQAGGKDPSQIPAALKRAETMVREALRRR